jgi:hypothetical protein
MFFALFEASNNTRKIYIENAKTNRENMRHSGTNEANTQKTQKPKPKTKGETLEGACIWTISCRICRVVVLNFAVL